MKKFSIFTILLGAAVFAGCSGDDDYIKIDSLSADGDEFFCNQKVKVWMCVNSSDLWHTDYQWSCEGGELTQPQGLNEETWKAPAVPGTYTITCTAKVGGKSETRTREMYVSSYYFEKFAKSSYNMSVDGSTTKNLKFIGDNQYLQVSVNSSSEYQRKINRSFGDNTLVVPFSTRMKIQFQKYIPNKQIVQVGSKKGNGTIIYRWNTNMVSENTDNKYVSSIRLEFYPGVPTDGYPTTTAPVIGGTDAWNVRVQCLWKNTNGKESTVDEYYYIDGGLNNFVLDTWKTVSLGVDENYVLHAYADGQEIITSNIVKDVRTTNGLEGPIQIKEWQTYFVNADKSASKNIPVMGFDDAYASNINDMLK